MLVDKRTDVRHPSREESLEGWKCRRTSPLPGLRRDLAARGESGKPIRIGLIGSGEMGTDIVTRVAHMPGIEIGAISELNLPNAVARRCEIAYGNDGDRASETRTGDELNRAIESGKIAVTSDANTLLDSALIDVVIDATGKPGVAADYRPAGDGARQASGDDERRGRRHHRRLPQAARPTGSASSIRVGAGDEPSSCMELIEFATALGYPIVSAGKGKNNPLNLDADARRLSRGGDAPEHEPAHAGRVRRRLQDHGRDGAIANATGLVPDVPGMHGPSGRPRRDGQGADPAARTAASCRQKGVVDYTDRQGRGARRLRHRRGRRIRASSSAWTTCISGKGPYYTFFRPYHLTSLEVPLTCARIMLYGKPDMVPLPKPVAEVCAVAKRDLAAGETFDAIGETCYRTWIMTIGEARGAGRHAVRPAGGRQGDGAGQEGRADHLCRTPRCRPTARKIAALRARQDAMLAGQKP